MAFFYQNCRSNSSQTKVYISTYTTKYFYLCTIENQLKEEKEICSIGIQFDYTIPLLGKSNN